MWIVGAIVLLVAGAAITVAIGWTPRAGQCERLWDIPELSGAYTGIVGILAGFSVTSAIFIAGLRLGQASAAFADTIGMLLISFLVLVGSAMMYSDTPAFPAAKDESVVVFQSLSHVLANSSYFLGLALGWLALRPLLFMIDLPALADAFRWLLLATVVAGSARLTVFVYRMTAATGAACAAIPLVGIALPAVYWLLAQRVWPGLWPPNGATLRFTFVAFAVASIGFLHQAAILLVHGSPLLAGLRRQGHRFALAYLQLVAISVGLVWFAVAMG
jgi:hypothetical protein